MTEKEQDFAVTRDVIMKFFSPPIGTTTFYDLVKRSKIAPVPGLRGYYRLNESLKRLKLPPVTKRPYSEKEKDSIMVLSQLALNLLMPGKILTPPQLLDRWLTVTETEKLKEMVKQFRAALDKFETDEDRMDFAQGVMDGAYMSMKDQT